MAVTVDIKNYDKGGWGNAQGNAQAGDGVLNGEEVLNARRNGWLVFEGHTGNDVKYDKRAKREALFTDSAGMITDNRKLKRFYTDKEYPYATYSERGHRNNSIIYDFIRKN